MFSSLCVARRGAAHLCILDDEMPGRQDQGNEGGGKEHLNDGDIAIVAAEYLGERVGMIYAEASGGACIGGNQHHCPVL